MLLSRHHCCESKLLLTWRERFLGSVSAYFNVGLKELRNQKKMRGKKERINYSLISKPSRRESV